MRFEYTFVGEDTDQDDRSYVYHITFIGKRYHSDKTYFYFSYWVNMEDSEIVTIGKEQCSRFRVWYEDDRWRVGYQHRGSKHWNMSYGNKLLNFLVNIVTSECAEQAILRSK